MGTERGRSPAEARSREELAALVGWRHAEGGEGRVGPGVFSQWCPSPFVVDGQEYATAEHWMMAGKARLFGDACSAERILAAGHPAEARKLGRRVRGFDEERWAAARFELVVRGNVATFGQDPALLAYLLGTGNRVLVEASPLDRIWGIGLAADDDRAADPARWPGTNLLGFALMEARTRLAGSQGG